MSNLHLRIIGMDCADCAASLEKGVGGLDGVKNCSVNFSTARLIAEFDPAKLSVTEISQRVRALGYDVRAEDSGEKKTAATRSGGLLGFIPFLFARLSTALAALGGVLVGLGMLCENFGAPMIASNVLYWL